jgi:hypothetical protein
VCCCPRFFQVSYRQLLLYAANSTGVIESIGVHHAGISVVYRTPRQVHTCAPHMCLTLRRYGQVLQELLPHWPALVSCLFAPGPSLAAAASKVLGQAGAIIWLDGLSRLAAATAAAPPAGAPTASTAGAGAGSRTAPPGAAAAAAALPMCPPELLFDWLLPLLTGQAPLPGYGRASASVQVGKQLFEKKD